MDRKGFLKSTMIATGSLLLGGAGICRFLNDKEPADGPFPRTIEKIHCGNMKKVLVIMSAGTKLGNTDRVTDAYIKGLVERGHSVTKVYLGSMRIYILCLQNVTQWSWLPLCISGQSRHS